MDQTTKRNLWIAGGVILLVALIAHHNITTTEIIIFCVDRPVDHPPRGLPRLWWPTAFGDDTAKRAGRLTLNPLPHIDPVGTLIVPALMSLGGFGFFGWAKPVPVNTARLRSPRNQGVLVSLAGPLTNAVLAGVFAVVFIEFVRADLLRDRSTSPSLGPGHLLLRPGQRRPVRLQHDAGAAARRFGALRAAAARRVGGRPTCATASTRCRSSSASCCSTSSC